MESVVQALKDSLRNQHCGFIDDVGDVYAVSEETIKDTLELLKWQAGTIKGLEQALKETLEVVSEQKNVVQCGECKHYKDGFCYNPNTYDDVITCGNTSPDWSCADGKRRETND